MQALHFSFATYPNKQALHYLPHFSQSLSARYYQVVFHLNLTGTNLDYRYYPELNMSM